MLTSAFLVMNIFFITEEVYWFLLIPVAIIIAALYFLSLDRILFFITLLTPLSIGITLGNGTFGLSIPTEPLLIGVTALFVLRLVFFLDFDKRILKHPVTISIVLYLFWVLITSINSQVPLVSFKFLLSKLWFIIPFYFLLISVFKREKNLRLFSLLYVFSLVIVVCYTIFRHAQYGFSEETGHWVMSPFYNDHTAYGAMLAFFLPVMFLFSRFKGYSKTIRLTSFIVVVVLMLALVLSFSRAAWVSLVVAIGVGVLIVLRVKFKWLATIGVFLIGVFFVFQTEIIQQLEKNTNESSENYIEHVRSIYNISSDASNLERINRWQAAIRLFKEKPLLGWGPGTYQFVYAPMQRTREKTIISTNAGDMGNAHSEYLGPLAEMGLVGMLLVLALISFVLISGIRVYRRAAKPEIKMLSLAAVLALVSYFTHGLINNFLDSDKASIPVWGMMAMIVAIDVFYEKKKGR